MMEKKKIYALGFFDGVHLGHQALLEACCTLAKSQGLESAVLTFDTHPQSLVLGHAPVLINHSADRARLLRDFGIDRVDTVRFDRQTMSMPWQEFFRYLLEEYHAAGIVCGDDFRFGYRGEGNAQRLCEACARAGIPCIVVPERTREGVRVSSTHIRGLIENGKMEEAVSFLGHPHVLTGQVVSGRRLGRTIGVPTANLLLPEGVIVPKFGVYACRVQVDGCDYPAVTNVGTRPTVGGHRVTVEPWILDFEGDLYGKTVTLQFYKFLRPEEKFPSLEALQGEILKNAAQTREFFENY
ncbi:MAG: bifunctional riboflavin kinase/FAD synthetase [Ruminococcaceae bacterium]|nr:bifunctional riboflavin kinase/FAD synthetase [Oscillospiraceae bacterium]